MSEQHGVLDVRAFGAIGDGVADDTRAIQTALAAARGGGAIYFPPGTYSLSAPVTVDASDVTIFGAGTITRLVLLPGSNSQILTVNTSRDRQGRTRLQRFAMRDLLFDHNGAQQVTPRNEQYQGPVAIFAVDHVDVANVHVRNARDCGLQVRACNFVKVRACVVEAVILGGAAGNGINVLGTDNAIPGGDYTIADCVVLNAHDRGIDVAVKGGSRATVTGCLVRGGTVGITMEANPGRGAGADLTVTGCVVEGCADAGIDVYNTSSQAQPAAERATVTGNVVRDCTDGIRLNDRQCVASANVISGCAGGIRVGIDLDYDQADFVVADNVIALRPEASRSGIAVSKKNPRPELRLRRLIVSGNTIDCAGSRRYGVEVRGKVADFQITNNVVTGAGFSGIALIADNGSPSEGTLIGNRVLNSNSVNDTANVANQSGIVVGGGCDRITLAHNRCYDDRSPKRQVHGLHVRAQATNIWATDNDLAGNLRAGLRVDPGAAGDFARNRAAD